MNALPADLPPKTPAVAAPRMALVGAAFGLFALGAFAAALVLEAPRAPAPVAEPPRLEAPAAPQPQPLAAEPAAVPQKAVPAKPARPAAASRDEAPREVYAQAERAEPAPEPRARVAYPACADCGVVESVRAVKHKGEATGIGAVAGAALGGLVGSRVGGGDGRKAMTVIGAVGGGLAGHEIEKRQRSTTVHEVSVRMADGSLRRVTQAEAVPVGQRVRVEGGRTRPLATDPGVNPAAGSDAERVLQASHRTS